MVSLQVAIAAFALSGVGQTVLLDFYSDSCPPCRRMNPIVQSLIDAGYPVQRVNVDRNRALADKFGVQRWPCFVMIVDGREVDRTVGITPRSRLEQMCQAGAPAAADARSAPMLARETAPQRRPEPLTSLPPASSAVASSNEPWNPSIPPQPEPAPLKPATVSDAALLAVSVRLRIEEPGGRLADVGSGTIIHSHGNEALVLTCGHVFRDSEGKGRITVDLFSAGSSEPQQVEGRLVSYNLTRDVGLVAIVTPGPVAAARLAPPEFRVNPGMAVASVGCDNGAPPTVRRSQINSLNKFQGPPNLQVAGQPVQGRSGGGLFLFSNEGYVIGVCNAADPSDHEGLFAAPDSIYAELDRAQLAFVYKSPSGDRRNAPAVASPIPSAIPGPTPGSTDLASLSSPATGTAANGVEPASATEPLANLAPHERAALDEIRRRQKEGAEVLVIVRPRGNPDAKSDVFVLDHASQALVRQLSDSRRQTSARDTVADGRGQDRRVTNDTSLELPKPRKVLLEWTKPVSKSS